MIRPGSNRSESGSGGRAPFGLRRPIDIHAANRWAEQLRVGRESRGESRFMHLAIDPLAVRAILLEIASQGTRLRGRRGHWLRWIYYRRVAEVGRARLAL